MSFEAISPILRVEDMGRALQFYVDLLGFKNAPWGDEQFTSVDSGKNGIYLCRGGQGRGCAWVWIGCENVRQLHRHLTERGVKMVLEPTNFPWALEMQVEDPDGNVLRFGSEPE